MALLNEMRRLTQGFLEAYDDRIAMVTAIRDGTARELSGFRAGHQRMAADQRQRLADYADGLRDNVTEMLKSFDTVHEAMAADQREHLGAGRASLASDVSKMRGDLQADQGEARKVWSSFAMVVQKRRAKKSGIPSSKAAGVAKAVKVRPAAVRRPVTVAEEGPPAVRRPIRVAEEAMPRAASEVIPDDLTTITGIGANRQQSLNEIGIYTFAQLAGSRPKKIRKVLGASGRLANVDQWIEEARRRS